MESIISPEAKGCKHWLWPVSQRSPSPHAIATPAVHCSADPQPKDFRTLDAGTTTGLALARRISEKEVASVRLLALELSEDEITVLAAALTTLLQELDDREIETKAGASRDEVEAILQDLHTFLKQPSQQSVKS
jgi:hypothetical protein